MFTSSDRPRDPTADALLSDNLADLMVPGVVVEVDAGEHPLVSRSPELFVAILT